MTKVVRPVFFVYLCGILDIYVSGRTDNDRSGNLSGQNKKTSGHFDENEPTF